MKRFLIEFYFCETTEARFSSLLRSFVRSRSHSSTVRFYLARAPFSGLCQKLLYKEGIYVPVHVYDTIHSPISLPPATSAQPNRAALIERRSGTRSTPDLEYCLVEAQTVEIMARASTTRARKTGAGTLSCTNN